MISIVDLQNKLTPLFLTRIENFVSILDKDLNF